MQLGVLGTVEVRARGELIDIGHPRQRGVLAILVVEAGKTVSIEQLTDRLWGDSPPRRARDTLYSYLSRLRGALADTDIVIDRQSSGYQLMVDPVAVDLHQFRRLVSRARGAGDDEALPLWDQALQLWRGEAFEELDVAWLDAIARGLDVERHAARLERHDLLLRRGQHAQLLPQLTVAAAKHPLDERLAAQVMLALCRCGRQADALAHYRDAHDLLVSEFGHDPGPELRRLHQQILRHDPALEISAPPAATDRPSPALGRADPSPPAQLPADIAGFTGRAADLRRLDALLPELDRSATTVVAAVGGGAGAGKSTLALHWAHRVHHRFPDGVLWVNLRGFSPDGHLMDPDDALRGFVAALGVQPNQLPASRSALTGLYRTLLTGRRVLVVLDNARDADQVRPLLPGSPGVFVLVTSRNPLTSLAVTDGAQLLPLDLLSTAEARQLLASRLGGHRVAREPATVQLIVDRCARLPLALAIVGARAATQPRTPLSAFADQLASEHDSLDALDGGDASSDVRSVFSWSYRALPPAAGRLFRLLGLAPSREITACAAASLAGLGLPDTRRRLAQLTRAHLIVETGPDRYTFHDLLRAYAIELTHTLDHGPDRRAAQHRLLDHYLHTAAAAARLMPYGNAVPALSAAGAQVVVSEPDSRRAAQAWFHAELPTMLAAVEQAERGRFDPHAMQLPWTLVSALHIPGRWQDIATTQQVSLRAAERLGDPRGQAIACRNLGHAYVRLERAGAARYAERAVALSDSIGDRRGHAIALITASFVDNIQGRYLPALRACESALTLYRDLNDPTGQALALNNLAATNSELGDQHRAISYCRQALALCPDDGARVAGNAWDTLGTAYHRIGDYQQAIDCFHRAVEVRRDRPEGYPYTLRRLGDTLHAAGKAAAAREAWRGALSFLDQLGHPHADQVRESLRQLAR